MKIDTYDLDGEFLDRAVSLAEEKYGFPFNLDTIVVEDTFKNASPGSYNREIFRYKATMHGSSFKGATAAIAAKRCYVGGHLGNVVDLPMEST